MSRRGEEQPDDASDVSLTPPGGIPTWELTQGAPGTRLPWPDRMRTLLRTPMSERPAFERSATRTSTGVSVPRVLDLVLRIGELLLASGEGAEDVEAAMLGVGHAYGLDRCEPNVTFTLISVSHQPSVAEAPLTADRVVRRRVSDYTRLAAVYRLVDEITSERASLEEAYRTLAEIRRNRHPYPDWLIALANGLLAGAASVLVGGGVTVFFASLVAALLGDRLAWILAGRGLPEFYQFVFGAMPAAVMGVLLHWLSDTTSVNVSSSAVITGGLFALIPGRALVAAVQDGLTGYYITASARLLEVMYLMVGVVCGVGAVLYVGSRITSPLSAPTSLRSLDRPVPQLLAALALTLTFAVILQVERRMLVVATLNGGVGWAVFGAIHVRAGYASVGATVVAAMLVGLFGETLARHQHASVLPYVIPALGPLLPGSATYFGLLSFTQGSIDGGWHALTRAAALALALAVGVNLGGEVARLFLHQPLWNLVPTRRRAAKRTRGF